MECSIAERMLELAARLENQKDPHLVSFPVKFELQEIREHFDESLDSIRKQFDIADSLQEDGRIDECKTIYRSQIVFLEGILDFYLHEITKYGLLKIFRGEWKSTERYKNLRIPMRFLDKVYKSEDWFLNYANEEYSCVVMQDWETIRDQLNCIGIMWKDVCMAMNPSLDEKHATEAVKTELKALYKRRNEIAHQNDRSHASAIQSDISKEYVSKAISFINSFVEAVHSLSVQQG